MSVKHQRCFAMVWNQTTLVSRLYPVGKGKVQMHTCTHCCHCSVWCKGWTNCCPNVKKCGKYLQFTETLMNPPMMIAKSHILGMYCLFPLLVLSFVNSLKHFLHCKHQLSKQCKAISRNLSSFCHQIYCVTQSPNNTRFLRQMLIKKKFLWDFLWNERFAEKAMLRLFLTCYNQCPLSVIKVNKLSISVIFHW